MANILEIIARANSLRHETALDSIPPERAGGIMYDTLLYINEMQLQESNPLLISKIYASVAAMEADSAPISDITGRALRAGQVVCIVTGDPDDPDDGVIYRYNGTTGGASSWTGVGRIGSDPYLEGYLFAGIATLTPAETDPGVPTQTVFYVASQPGTYENFDNLVVNDGEVAVFKYDSAWSKSVTGAATAAALSAMGSTLDGKITELGQKVFDIPAFNSSVELVTRLRITVGEMSFVGTKRYELTFLALGLTDTDIDNLDFFCTQSDNAPAATPVLSYSFTSDDKASLKATGKCKIRIEPNVSTEYIRIQYSLNYVPGDGKTIVITSYLFIDTIEAFEGINAGDFADKAVEKNSGKLITGGAVYDAAMFEETEHATFTMESRSKTDVQLAISKDDSYTLTVGVSGLSDTDIDNLQRIRTATGTAAGDYVFDHLFTNVEKAALKNSGFCKFAYTAEYDTSYIHLYFVSGYTPTSGNTFIVSSILALTTNEISHRINGGEFADKVPVKNSNRLITSGAVYEAEHISMNVGSVSFVMEGRYNNSIKLSLGNGRTYSLKISVSGLSNTDIDNLQYFRLATGTAAGDYVYSHSFTDADKTALKANGHCFIEYTAEQDTNYIHLYFTAEYTPTSGNVFIIDAFSIYALKDVFVEEVDDNVRNFLYGKTVVLFGDSITEFAGRGEGVEPKRYSDYLEEYCGVTAINVGIGGTCLRQRHDPVIVEPGVYHISDYGALDIINMVRAACGVDYDETYSYLDLAEIAAEQIKLYKDTHDDNTAQIARLAAIDWTKVDYVTFLGGTNDWHGGASLGESGNTDVATTLGAINEIIRILLTTYPHVKILWFTPPVRWIGYDGTEESKIKQNFSDYYQIHNLTLKEFSAGIKNEVILNHIPVCDFYNELGWNMYNFAQYFGNNETHPFRGNDYLARKMANFFYSH